jgi:hypothetical protein
MVAASACSLFVRSADARSQWSVSGQFGVVVDDLSGGRSRQARFDLGLRSELLLGREATTDWAAGPYLEARTSAFTRGDFGGGLIALAPVHPTFPVWFGVGGFARAGEQGWVPGASAWVAWGGRSLNFSGSYGMAYGLLVDARASFGPQPGVDVVAALTLDLEALALPFVYVGSWLAH